MGAVGLSNQIDNKVGVTRDEYNVAMSNVDNNGGIGPTKAQVDIRGVGPGGFSSIEDMAAPVSSFRHREMMGEQKHVEAGKMARYFESGSL